MENNWVSSLLEVEQNDQQKNKASFLKLTTVLIEESKEFEESSPSLSLNGSESEQNKMDFIEGFMIDEQFSH